MKSLAQLDKEFDAIMKMSEKADVDPNTIKGKWEKAKEKWLNSEDGKLVKAGKVAGGVAAVISLGLLAAKIIPEMTKGKAEFDERRKKALVSKAESLERLEQASRFQNVDHGKAIMEVSIRREQMGLWAQAIGLYESRFQKIVDAVARAVDRFSDRNGDKAAAYRANLNHALNTARDNEIRQAARSEYGKRLGTDAYINAHKSSPSNPKPNVTNITNNNQRTYNTVNHNDMMGASVRIDQRGGRNRGNNKPKK